MAEKLTALTKEQEDQLAEYRDKWVAIGQSAGATDRDKAAAAINNTYACAGLRPPRIKIWLRSPREGVIAAWWLKQLKMLKGKAIDQVRAKIASAAGGEKTGDQVGDRVKTPLLTEARSQLQNRLGSRVEAQIKEQLTDKVKTLVKDDIWGPVHTQIKDKLKPDLTEQVWTQVWIQVWTQLWPQAWSTPLQSGVQLGGQVRAEVIAQTRDQVQKQIEDLLTTDSHGDGLHDANLLAAYDFFSQCLGINTTKLAGLEAAARECGWFWPFEGIAVITEKPTELHRDDKGRLHNEKDMSIKYADGWGIWFWHGTPVDSWVVTNPEKITLDAIDKEKNSGTRRVMRERFGLQEFFMAMIREGKAKRLGRRKDDAGNPMALFRYDEKEGPIFFAHVYNSAIEENGMRREFILPCKNVADDAWDSLNATYPDMMKNLKGNPRRFELIKAATRG